MIPQSLRHLLASPCCVALFGIALFAGAAQADVMTYSQAAASDPNIVVQYSFDGATLAERQEDKSAGTNNLNVATQGSGSGAAITYASGFDASSDAATTQRINGSNGAAFLTSGAVNRTTSSAYSYEAILRLPSASTSGFGYIFSSIASTSSRDYWSVHQDSSGTNSVITISGNAFSNSSNIISSIEGGDWYFVSVTKELIAGNTQVNTWMANLSNGDTLLTQIVSDQTVAGSFQHNTAMGVGTVFNAISSVVQEMFSGSIDEISLYSGLRTQSDFQTSLNRILAPAPVPTPAALPAGLALLGAVTLRRRR